MVRNQKETLASPEGATEGKELPDGGWTADCHPSLARDADDKGIKRQSDQEPKTPLAFSRKAKESRPPAGQSIFKE